MNAILKAALVRFLQENGAIIISEDFLEKATDSPQVSYNADRREWKVSIND